MIKNKEEKTIKETVEDFFCSDSIPATATKFLLMTVALGGVAFVGALAPGLISLADEFKPNGRNRYSKKEIKNAVYNLKKRKLIKIIKDKD